jgi:hypothetical protein
MPLQRKFAKTWFARLLPGVMFAALALFAGAPRAKADDWDDCNRRIAYANWQLHEAIEDYGYNSGQAKHWRHELHEEYERQQHLRRQYRNEQWNREWRDRRDYNNGYYADRNRWYEDEYGSRHYRRDRDEDDD